MKKYIVVVCTIVLCLLSLTHVNAQDEEGWSDDAYTIVTINSDGTFQNINAAKTYEEAKISQTLLQLRYENIGIVYHNNLVHLLNGVVAFKKESDCSLNISYRLDGSNETGYTNGCYGGDAAFLDYNVEDDTVKFMLGGVIGWVAYQDVELYPLEALPGVSSFTVNDKILYHNIKSDVHSATYANQLTLGTMPADLKNDTTYYSYDTHYFYTTYANMILDYREGKHTRAQNANNPYYNYYQYMNHRTTSTYEQADINAYMQDNRMLRSTMTQFRSNGTSVSAVLTQSMLLQGNDAFLQYQNQFGANSLMMLSLAMNESASGKSYLSFTRNNVFGHAAYDSSVDESASRYSSIAASIYSHARHYISTAYLDATNFTYHGGQFGNKAGGMNVSYASDPYWGEKAAQYYYTLDSAMGGKDYGQYALGITNKQAVDVKDRASADGRTIYSTPAGYEVSFVLLEHVKNSEGSWYRIQSDQALNEKHEKQEDGTYNFSTSIAYIKADTLATIINANQLKAKNYVDITFQAGDGMFYPDTKQITLQVEVGKMPVMTAPVKEHAIFNGWDITLSKATTKLTYHATYKNVREINLTTKPKTQYALNDSLDIQNGILQVLLEDGTAQEVSLTTDMISRFTTEEAGKQMVDITYAGTTISYEIEVSDQQTASIETLQTTADYLIRNYHGIQDLKDEARNEILAFYQELKQFDTLAIQADQLRSMEPILQENIHPQLSVIIKDDVYDLQISALHMAISERDSLLYNIMPRTLAISLKQNVSSDQRDLFENVAKANEVTLDDTFTIRGKDNFSGYALDDYVVYSIKKPEQHDNRIYRIYQLQGDDVIALTTTQSTNRIVFYSNATEPFALVSYPTSSLREESDHVENYTIENNGVNYINRYILLPIGIIFLLILGIILCIWYRKTGQHWMRKKQRTPGKSVTKP